MKKFILGAGLGLLVGVGALFGLAQIPSVRDVVLKSDTTTSTSSSDEIRQENSTLKTQVDTLNSELSDIKTQLSDKETALSEKEDQVQTLTSERDELQTKLKTAEEERDTYKDLVGVDNVTLSQTVVTLTTQLSEKKSELESATAELEQLKVDKETLIARVSELETQLAEAQEKLKGYETLENIETLDIANYEGKWYLDGEFKDYYIIEDGVVTHNASEDTGVIQCLKNQVYLFMNTAGSEPVNLSVDGLSFEKSDGSTYKKFYTNTDTAVVKSASFIAGTYSLDNKSITINVDNTLSMFDGENTYYGAYTFTSTERNIGGNKNITSVVTANINTDDGQETKTFTISSKYMTLEYENDFYSFVSLSFEPSSLGYSGSTNLTIKTDKVLTIYPGETVDLVVRLCPFYNNSTCVLSVNDIEKKPGGVTSDVIYSITNTSGDIIFSNLFKFYVKSYSYYRAFVVNICSFGESKASLIGGSCSNEYVYLSSSLYPLSSSFSSISCSTISAYTDGNYNLTDSTLSITDNSAIITPTDGEEITASTCDITAKTDGYDIFHTATITYVTTELVEDEEVETTHTLVIEYTNNTVASATLDGESTEITKN